MADLPWEKYQQGPWSKYADVTPTQSSTVDIIGQSVGKGTQSFLNLPRDILSLSVRMAPRLFDISDEDIQVLAQEAGKPGTPEYQKRLDQLMAAKTAGRAPYERAADWIHKNFDIQNTYNLVGLPKPQVPPDSEMTSGQRFMSKTVEGLASMTPFAKAYSLARNVALAPQMKSAASAAVGSAALSEGGREIGGETGAKIGEFAGLFAGPLALNRVESGIKAFTGPSSGAVVDVVQGQKNATYALSEKANVVVSQNAMQGLASDIRQSLAGELGQASIHPQANAAWGYIQQQVERGDITLRGLDMLRRSVKGTLYQRGGKQFKADVGEDDVRLVEMMVDKIDDFIGRLGPARGGIVTPPRVLSGGQPQQFLRPEEGVIMGDAAQGTQALVRARMLNTKYKKAETIQDAIFNADTRKAPFDDAIRNELATLARSPKMASFLPEERAAILQIVNEGVTQKTLKVLGAPAPISSNNRLLTTLHAMGLIGTHTVAPEQFSTLLAGAIGSEFAKRMSVAVARKDANKLVMMMAMGFKPPKSLDLEMLAPAIENALQKAQDRE